MKKIVLIASMIILLLFGFVSCDGDVDEKLFGKGHDCTYAPNDEGTWVCTQPNCSKVHPKTDAPYFAIVKDGKIDKIVPLTTEYQSGVIPNLTFVKDYITYNDDGENTIYLKTTESQTVNITAGNSDVYHYQGAYVVILNAVANNSYHLNGEVKDLVIRKGNVVLGPASVVEDLSIAKKAAATEITITKDASAEVQVMAVYANQTNVTVNGKTVEEIKADNSQDVVTEGIATISTATDVDFYRVKTAVFTNLEEAKAAAVDTAVRIIKDVETTSETNVESQQTMKIAVDVKVTVPGDEGKKIAVEESGTLEVYGDVDNRNQITNNGSIKNYGSIITSGTNTSLDNKQEVKNYGTIDAHEGAKIVTTGTDSKIENYGTIDVKEGSTLEVSKDSQLTNSQSGAISNSGTIKNEGTIKDSGKITQEEGGKIENTGTIDATASTTDSNIYVAAIGNEKYIKLEDAIEEAEVNDTITVINNVTLDNSITVDQNITLDLNGKTVSAVETDWKGKSPTSQALFYVKSGATFTIKDSVGTGRIDANNNADIYGAVALTIKDNNEENKIAKLVVNGGTLKGYYFGVVTNGLRHNTEIVINGGEFTSYNMSDGTSIYHPNKGELTINGGTFEGYDGLAIKGGNVTITGGTFEAQGRWTTPTSAQGSGANSVGAALYVEGNYQYAAKIVITGGTFITTDSNAPVVYMSFNEKPEATIEIKGGTFSSSPNNYVAPGYYGTKSDDVWNVEFLFAGGDGTENNPFLISTVDQLQSIDKVVSSTGYSEKRYYQLTDDIVIDADKTKRVKSGNYYYNVVVINGLNFDFDGNGKSIEIKCDDDKQVYPYLFYQTQNFIFHDCQVTINDQALVLNGKQGTKFENVDVYGYLNVGNNTGAYIIYSNWDATFIDCDSYVDIRGAGAPGYYDAIYVGYTFDDPQTFVNCNNYGSIVCGKATMFVGNVHNGYKATIIATSCTNYGTIHWVDVDNSKGQYGWHNEFLAGSAQCLGKLVLDGVEYTTKEAIQNAHIDNKNGGSVIWGPEDPKLRIEKNQDKTLTITKSTNTDIAYYKVVINTYAGLLDGGSRQVAVSETITNISPDKLVTKLKVLDFVDTVWCNSHQEAENSELAGNSIRTYGGTEYYYIEMNDAAFGSGHVSHFTSVSVTGYSSEGIPIATASLSKD